MTAPESLALVLEGTKGPIATASRVLQADAAAVIVVIVILAFMVLLVVAGKRKPRVEAEPDEPVKLASPTKATKVPASKETFEPLPEAPKPKPAAATAPPSPVPSIETPDDEVVPVDSAWELGDDDESAARAEAAKANEAEAAKKRAEAEEKKREADDKAKAAEAKKREAEEAKKRAEAELKTADDAVAQAAAAKAAEEAKAAAEAAKKAEQEARAEAARAAEARDKAIKEAAERAKAEAKAAAEAEAKAKAEARRKEQEQKAKVEADAKAKADAEAKKEAAKREDEAPAKTLKDGLGRTRKEGFIAKLSSLFAGKQIDQDLLDEVEEALFTSDIGVRTADRLLSAVREALSKKELKDANKVWDVLRGEAQKILEGANAGAKVGTPKPGEPFVTMVLGVNGTGKTTSIGKLAHKLLAEKKNVVLVAGDTFRAAATEQLEHWARRVGAPCIKGKEGADPASVVFDGVKQGLEQKADMVLVDTAGRLHNNTNLMEELKKVRRVMGRAIESAPHEVLMVLDATTGQNGITQAKLFKDATDVTGIILTKLDGTAKGGVVLGVCDELKIPIKWIGVGERVADLRPFDAREFVDELFAPPG